MDVSPHAMSLFLQYPCAQSYVAAVDTKTSAFWHAYQHAFGTLPCRMFHCSAVAWWHRQVLVSVHWNVAVELLPAPFTLRLSTTSIGVSLTSASRKLPCRKPRLVTLPPLRNAWPREKLCLGDAQVKEELRLPSDPAAEELVPWRNG